MSNEPLSVGKLPPPLLTALLQRAPIEDPRVLIGPGPGLDCAVIDLGDRLLVFKSDPITFATDDIGWYLVQVNANDIATTGATPRWLMLTQLLPSGNSTAQSVLEIADQVFDACRSIGVSVIGGHTEITYGLDRPILAGTMIGEVDRDNLVTPLGATPGDKILLTKGVPIEATAILAREIPETLALTLSEGEIVEAQNFLKVPGISILQDAQIAMGAGSVTAMHDPTEGGIASALWEMAEASQRELIVNLEDVHVPTLAGQVCQAFSLNPMAAISSGALLLTVSQDDCRGICLALEQAGIRCDEIGWVKSGSPWVWDVSRGWKRTLARPDRDEIARVFDDYA